MVITLEKWFLRVAPPLAIPLALASLAGVFFWVPSDKMLGLSQRIFYWHVPAATTCFLAFAAAGVASIAYLRTRRREWDQAAHASVSVGILLATVVLATGCIWGKIAWGAYWSWDARLTTFLVLWLVFAAYLLLRSFARENDMAPRYAAVLAIVGAINVPLVMMATRLFRTIHPQVINNPQGGIDDPRMKITFALSMFAFLFLLLWMWALRFSVLRLSARVEELQEEAYGRSLPS